MVYHLVLVLLLNCAAAVALPTLRDDEVGRLFFDAQRSTQQLACRATSSVQVLSHAVESGSSGEVHVHPMTAQHRVTVCEGTHSCEAHFDQQLYPDLRLHYLHS